MIIKNGRGVEYPLEINKRFQAETRSTSLTEEHDRSLRDGQAYFANTGDTALTLTAANGNTYNVIYLENTSATQLIVIEKILVSSDTLGGVWGWYKNSTLGTPSNNNSHSPVNMNLQSGNSASATCHTWDEVGTSGIGGLTLGTLIKSFITAVGFTPHPIDGAIILGQGNNFAMTYTNNTGGNIEFECGIRFHFVDPVS